MGGKTRGLDGCESVQVPMTVSVSRLLLLCLQCLPIVTWAGDAGHLTYFETLNHVTVSTRVTRSSPTTGGSLRKEVRFRAFQRNFHLSLSSGVSVLTNNFVARLVHGDGSSTRLHLDQSKLFTGHVVGAHQSQVTAHLEGSLWSIQIFEAGEGYAVEPAWRILTRSENPHNASLVAYRLSDINGLHSRHNYCGAGPGHNLSRHAPFDGARVNNGAARRAMGGSSRFKSPHARGDKSRTGPRWADGSSPKKRREKRAVRDTCQIHLVADTDFFTRQCHGDHVICTARMVTQLQAADSIYRTSRFEGVLGQYHTGIGLQVAEVTVLADYVGSRGPKYYPHYNVKYNWTAEGKLFAFSLYMSLLPNHVCLYHLFSDFWDRIKTLGLAFTNTLCGRKMKDWDGALNVAIHSASIKGKTMPLLYSTLTLAHEIGHNFGANHDPDTPECAPDESRGGNYLMWAVTLTSVSPNNAIFSPCSLREIGRNVPAWCFKERTEVTPFCGNGMVDGGEQCDSGFNGTAGIDKCCTRNCTLQKGAVCSEVNHECCVDCQVAPASTVCYDPGHVTGCREASYCTGYSNVCPEGSWSPDDTVCGEGHVCLDGACVGPCQKATHDFHNGTLLRSCRCESSATEMCQWCCYDASHEGRPGPCRPIKPDPRSDGSPCHMGQCVAGVCRKKVVKTVLLLDKYINFVQKSSLETFLRTNVVSVVIVLSLVVWLPPVILVHRRDCAERRLRDAALDAELLLSEIQQRQAEEGLDHSTAQRPGGTVYDINGLLYSVANISEYGSSIDRPTITDLRSDWNWKGKGKQPVRYFYFSAGTKSSQNLQRIGESYKLAVSTTGIED